MEELRKILENFKNKKILVIGDLILDTYLEGNVSRISPEAPVPILNVKNKFNVLGGAGNVAANISSLGGKARLFGFLGNDTKSKILMRLMKKNKIDYICQPCKDEAIRKTRILGNNQQIIRFDEETISRKILTNESKDILRGLAKNSDLIIISDYAKGTITTDLMECIKDFKNKTVVDPKPKNKSIYDSVLLITPNEKEALELSQEEDLEKAGEKLKKEFNSNILLTLGEKGMALFSNEKNIKIPTYAKEVYDVSGAGDTVIATISLALSSGANFEQAAILANYAAGIVVEKKGTYALSFNELKNRLESGDNKILEFELLKKRIFDLKEKKKKIVWTNGCFDLLHVGHIRYLSEAKKKGDVLIIGLNSDFSIKKLKGDSRPIQEENERAEIISSLNFVDYVFIFNEESPEKYLRELKPDVYVKGGDYDINSLNPKEIDAVSSYGGKIEIVNLSQDKSTTNIIKKIKSLE
jgi:D-beta-D-heptose 7-phosphate kinase/D-beta-D-heptose 1-phosphate adenosyltransferase